MKKLKLSFVFAFLSFFFACVSDVEPVYEWLPVVEKNSENPYEEWGYVHNIGLDFIESEISTMDLTGKDTNEVVLMLVLEFMKEQKPAYQQDDSLTLEKLKKAISDRESPNLDHLKSVEARNMFRELDTHVQTFKYDMDLKKFQQIIIGLESDMLKNIADSTEKAFLLQSASVARYSAAYWYVEYLKIMAQKMSFWKFVIFPNGRIEASDSDTRPAKRDHKGGGMRDKIASSGVK